MIRRKNFKKKKPSAFARLLVVILLGLNRGGRRAASRRLSTSSPRGALELACISSLQCDQQTSENGVADISVALNNFSHYTRRDNKNNQKALFDDDNGAVPHMAHRAKAGEGHSLLIGVLCITVRLVERCPRIASLRCDRRLVERCPRIASLRCDQQTTSEWKWRCGYLEL